ncbi:MAG: acetoacetate decarboxylase family protein [Candidatus Dadabacteria bacterium]|nr:acetoacetate decarboxylase family protein [Candidatus Dadabacteria bacterium]
MKSFTKRMFITLFVLSLAFTFSTQNNTAMADDLPGPQLVTDAWMFIASYKADPKVLKAMLPEGLEPNPEGTVVINMYTVPNGNETSGFGPYTLTYLTVELAGQDSYVMNSDITYPGRYFIFYFNSSPVMREFTEKVGMPVNENTNVLTTTTVENGKLTATLTVDGKPFIVSTADVGSELGNFGGGHFNYFGLISEEKDGKTVNKVVKYPIPWNGGVVDTQNAKVMIKAPKDHPLHKVKPIADPTLAIWTKGSFVYPQYQVVNEYTTEAAKK